MSLLKPVGESPFMGQTRRSHLMPSGQMKANGLCDSAVQLTLKPLVGSRRVELCTTSSWPALRMSTLNCSPKQCGKMRSLLMCVNIPQTTCHHCLNCITEGAHIHCGVLI